MATLISNSSGNFTSSSTWSLVDTTSFSNSEAANTATTTSFVSSATFVPGAINVDGLAIKVLSHTAVGNVSVRLGKSGTITANTIANPTQVTSLNHGLTTNEAVLIAGSNSTPALAGPYTVTVIDANTFSVPVNVTVAGTAGTWSTVKAAITSNTLVATPVFTTSLAHGLTVGTQITIRGSTATPSYNGTWTIATTPATTTFTLTGAPSASGGVSGGGTYTIVGVPDTLVVAAAADLPTVNTATNDGWAFFKFPASITLTAGTTYDVRIQGTTAGNVTAYRTATAGDWSRLIRTTTTQAPVATDTLFVAGEYISPGSNNTFTVTNDNTATTTFGAMEVASKGTLSYGVAASTNYYLKHAGDVLVYTGGTLNIGTTGSPMPATSTGKLEIVCSSNVQFGLTARNGGAINTGGNLITNTANLAADASAAATSLTTDVSTGWLSGDVIAIASTTRTRAECESKALTANAVGTALTISAITNAHGGTAPIVAELANLTRNVSIFSTSTTNQMYIDIDLGAVVNFSSTEFYNMGSATTSRRGIDIASTTGSCSITNCSIHDFNVASSIGMNVATNAANVTISNNVLYNIANVGLNVAATTNAGNVYNNNICILSGASCFVFSDIGGTITNITAVGGLTRGTLLAEFQTTAAGTITNIISHSNTGPGIDFTNYTGFRYPVTIFNNFTSWRNTTNGITINNTFNIKLDGVITLFGNATANISYGGSAGNVFFRGVVSNAGTVLTCPLGVSVGSDIKECYFDSCTFGVTTTHATGDFSVIATNIYPRVYVRNSILNSATPVANPGNMIDGGQINSTRHQQTSGNHRLWRKFGTMNSDTTIFNRGSPSLRVTPNNATFKLFGDVKKIAVPSGQSVVVSVYLRKSIAGDGSAYNGNQPRLMLRADSVAGVAVDTVLATADNTYNGVFKLFSGTTPVVSDDCVIQVYIDCDGTAGWINLDDWSVDS